MSPGDIHTLLVEAPAGRHLAQFHRDSLSLVTSVGLYVAEGLERGAGVVVLATPAHTAEMIRHVTRAGLNADALRQAGRFVVLDADATLARIMRGGRPDPSEFRRVIGPLVEHLGRVGPAGCRAYSEMVSVLWGRGKRASAIELDGLWNSLVQTQPFSLLSAYVVDAADQRSIPRPAAVGRTWLDLSA